MSYYRTALLLVIASSVANSANGLIVRSMEAADGWQIVFYRSWFLAGALAIVFVVQVGGRVRAALLDLRPWMVVGSLLIATVNTCFILAITHTTVANTMFLLSGAPFFAALLGRIVLGEVVARGVWIAMSVALLGMGVMLWDGLGAGTLFGNSLALLAAFGFGAFAVVLRKGRGVNMLPIVVLGAVLGGLNAALMCGGEFAIPLRDAALLFVWGALLSGDGARHLHVGGRATCRGRSSPSSSSSSSSCPRCGSGSPSTSGRASRPSLAARSCSPPLRAERSRACACGGVEGRTAWFRQPPAVRTRTTGCRLGLRGRPGHLRARKPA